MESEWILRPLKSGAIVVLFVLICLGYLPRAFASGPTGKIVGTVTDNSGAAVRAASVSAINQDIGETRIVQTGAGGEFALLSLPVGRYTIKVEASGFKTYEEKDIVL